jgi:hypothetical protein
LYALDFYPKDACVKQLQALSEKKNANANSTSGQTFVDKIKKDVLCVLI